MSNRFYIDPGSGICNGNSDLPVTVHRGSDNHQPALRPCVKGVVQQVQPDLFSFSLSPLIVGMSSSKSVMISTLSEIKRMANQ